MIPVHPDQANLCSTSYFSSSLLYSPCPCTKKCHGEKVHTRTYTAFCRKSFARTRSLGAAAAEPKTRVRLNTPLQNRNIIYSKLTTARKCKGRARALRCLPLCCFAPDTAKVFQSTTYLQSRTHTYHDDDCPFYALPAYTALVTHRLISQPCRVPARLKGGIAHSHLQRDICLSHIETRSIE